MINLILLITIISSLLVGKYFFKRMFNPVFLYSGSWAFTIYLYNLRLLGYTPISNFAWTVVVFAYISFLLGILIVYLGRGIHKDYVKVMYPEDTELVLWDKKKIKTMRLFIIVTAIIGLLVSIQHWYVLIKEFGSITMVLLNAKEIYLARVGGEHYGKIPYLNLLSYVSVYFSAIYSAHQNKFTYLVIFPLLAVILTDAAIMARAGVFFAFVLFGITFLTSRYYFKSKSRDIRYYNNKNIILTITLFILIAIGSVSLIRFVRNPLGDFKSTSIKLKEASNTGIISSSIYLYFSSPLPVLTEYFENRDEIAVWGENTFFPVYNIANKFGANIRLTSYPVGYFVPMWVNSATYLRELDVDFGPIGILFVPFLIGFLSTLFWYKYFETGSLFYLTFYGFTSVLIVFSIFYIGTRLTAWLFGFIFSILSVIYFEKLKTKPK